MKLTKITEGDIKEGDLISFTEPHTFSDEKGENFTVDKDTGAMVEKVDNGIITLIVYKGCEIITRTTIKQLEAIAEKIVFEKFSPQPL